MATEPQERWIIFQYHGHHGPGSLEDTLRCQGGPFIFGRHRLDSPDLHPYLAERGEYLRLLKTDPDAAEAMAKPMIDRYGLEGWWRQFPFTEKPKPDPPPTGGYPHLSWCYVNMSQQSRADPPWTQVVEAILQADAGAHLCLWMQMVHPDLPGLIESLQARYRGRHVSVYHKRGIDAATEFDGSGQPAEDWLWQHCDLRYFAPAGLVAKGAKHFWKRLAFDWRTIPVIHSSVTLDDLNAVLVRTELLLGQHRGVQAAAAASR